MSGFVHLHVASGFSMRYGASTPEALVERAVAYGQGALALTDRDGLYGAVRFTRAAEAAGVTPVLGVDLAVDDGPYAGGAAGRAVTPPDAPPARTPVRGGALVDSRLPRVTVLARGVTGGVPHGRGWAALCRLVTDTHLRGERSRPVTTPALLAHHATTSAEYLRSRVAKSQEFRTFGGGPPALLVMLGPDSDVGRALLARRDAEARERLLAWRALLPEGALVVETVHHGGPDGTPGCRSHAAHLVGLADACGIPAVVSAAVRHADPGDVRTVDVLDAARRLVLLDSRHLDRVTSAGHLCDEATVRRLALEALGDAGRVDRLLATTAALAAECAQDGRRDLGIGSVHLPEASVLGIPYGVDPQQVLTERCHAAVARRYPGATERHLATVRHRLDTELAVIAELGYPTYFLTVAEVTDLIRARGVRVAARGSGAGSLVNHLLGISGVDPVRHDLLMERFISPLRAELPDIDVDVESARRTEIYEAVLERFGGDRVTCVSMMDTYKVRHAVRDVGAALGFPQVEIDEIATAFPHISARGARQAIAELPELRRRGLDAPRLQTFFELVESLDGLPRHIALHPCGVVLSDGGLLDRTPVEASWLGFPMSQFDKDDVETLGLLKLDILGIRMQSAMAHAVAEVERVDGIRVDLDDEQQVPLDDEPTYRMIRTTRTLGCFQIESPGQRELIGKFGPERFLDLIIDISLFRPGPVKSDMITPFLRTRHGWEEQAVLHPTLTWILDETEGVVVFHEQVLRIVAETTGVTLAQADEVRRTMGSVDGQAQVEAWWRPAAKARGYSRADRDRIWEVLRSFASFGFCKAHAAAFALPTYHSAWLKTHHPAAFLAGVLTHDPGMYPKRLILDDARLLGITVLPLDVNASADTWRVERLEPHGSSFDQPPPPSDPDLPDGTAYGIRVALTEVKGISAAEVASLVAAQPYRDLGDFWQRAGVSRPVVERLVLTGGFDALHGIRLVSSGSRSAGMGRRGRVTRRDLLLHVAELDRHDRALAAGRRRITPRAAAAPRVLPAPEVAEWAPDVRERAAAQSQAAQPAPVEAPVQLTLELGDRPDLVAGTGLPELSPTEQVRAELDVLGLDASAHVIDFYAPLLQALGVTRAADLLTTRSRSEVLVAGVKVATQTPPVRSGRRVVFLTVEDGTGPADATFFEDVQGPYAATVFHSWLLVVRGITRRTGARGISLRATGAWELPALWEAWRDGGLDAVYAAMAQAEADAVEADGTERPAVGADGRRRVLVHASGFRQSPYADTRPAGGAVASVPGALPALPDLAGGPPGPLTDRKLWHASPGSSGR